MLLAGVSLTGCGERSAEDDAGVSAAVPAAAPQSDELAETEHLEAEHAEPGPDGNATGVHGPAAGGEDRADAGGAGGNGAILLSAEWEQVVRMTNPAAQNCQSIHNAKPEPTTSYEKDLWIGRKAADGDVAAQVTMGHRYRYGEGTLIDYTKAAYWFRAAAEQGDATAEMELGRLYADGNGVEKDEVEAARLFRAAAVQGELLAQYFIGWAYQTGSGVDQDYAEAMRWYLESARQGNQAASFAIGIMYNNGNGVEKDLVLGMAWMIQSEALNQPVNKSISELITKQLTPEQIAEANRISKTLP